MGDRTLLLTLVLILCIPRASAAQTLPDAPDPGPAIPYRSALAPTVDWTGPPRQIAPPAPASAQRTGDGTRCFDSPVCTGAAFLGGAVGGVVGGLAGFYGGLASAELTGCGGWGCIRYPVWGIVVGTTLFIPAGAHLVVGKRGHLVPPLLTSAAVLALGAATAAAAMPRLEIEMLMAIPIAQLITSTFIALATEPAADG